MATSSGAGVTSTSRSGAGVGSGSRPVGRVACVAVINHNVRCAGHVLVGCAVRGGMGGVVIVPTCGLLL